MASVWVVRARNVAVVTVLAGLAWLLAESQTLQNEVFTVRVTLGDQGEAQVAVEAGAVARAAPGQAWEGRVEVHAAGSAALIDALVDQLTRPVELSIGREIPGEPGTHEVLMREALRTTEAFRDSGVTITSVTPDRVRVEVDELVSREVPVVVVLPGGVEVSEPASATPDTARIVAPSRVLEDAGESLTVSASVPADALRALVPGRAEAVGGVRTAPPAALAGRWAVRVEPAVVGVSIALESRSQTMTIPRIPVHVLLAPSELERPRWRIEIEPADQDLVDVVLTGPREALDRISRNEVRPRAIVPLSFEELEAGVGSKRAQVVGLPEGVTAQVERDEIRLRIGRVEEEGAGVPGGAATP